MRRVEVVALLLVGALIVVGCLGAAWALSGGDSGDDGADEAGSAAGTPLPERTEPTPRVALGGVPRELRTFYRQSLAWEQCGANECATLEVPIDYTDVSAGTTEIALERTRATGERQGSLVVNPGGPGAPGTDVATQADLYFAPELLAAYDVVGFDPRGTGDSDPVDCLSDAELDAYVAQDPAPDTAAEETEFVDELDTFWSGCQRRSDSLAGHVSTVEAARDMDVLRSVLGEERLRYFGYSYGTRLGATYAELFPERVGRFVLDGAIDPSLDSRRNALSQAEGFETALRSYVGDCVDQGDCFLGDSVEDGLDTIVGLLDRIDDAPLPADDPERDLEIGNAFYGLILPLYAKENWPVLDQALRSALEGDGTTLLFLSDHYGSRESGAYTDNSLEAISVINCLDDPSAFTRRQVAAQMPDFLAASPTFGEVFAWGMLGCAGIPYTATDEPDLEIDGSGAAPIVVIGTTRDPATPYQEAVAMADQLESGVLVSRDGDGHTAYNRGNDCVDTAVHDYLLDGVVPEDGLEC
ncbi:alpha/beta hydrolase [Nocardioides sambongensis]|uniref:alpha/beta hydrolase n=1 Tax=Nocardioides sambongensis TaxID=2589074 RepID=UPI00112B0D2D|nr:alpha/beta hydrolase [Nocardioides sambongensis]